MWLPASPWRTLLWEVTRTGQYVHLPWPQPETGHRICAPGCQTDARVDFKHLNMGAAGLIRAAPLCLTWVFFPKWPPGSLDQLRPEGSAGSWGGRLWRRRWKQSSWGEGHQSHVNWWSHSKVLSLNCLWTISAGLLPRVGGSASHWHTHPCIWIVMWIFRIIPSVTCQGF